MFYCSCFLEYLRGLRYVIVISPNRDHSFNLNDFIRSLRTELKSWRRVFWRLWGMVHPLYCSLCSSHFPVYLNEFCRFHPQVRCFSCLCLSFPIGSAVCAICSQNSRAIILPHAYHARHLPCHHYFYFRTPTSPPSNSRTRASPSGDTRAARPPSSATSRAPTSRPSTATAPPQGDRARLPPTLRPPPRPPPLPRRRCAIQQRERKTCSFSDQTSL